MSGIHGGFDPLARRSFRLWREIDTTDGADGYVATAMALAGHAAALVADDGRVVVGMAFTIERTNGVLQLVAVGTARVASPGTIDARAIGGDAP